MATKTRYIGTCALCWQNVRCPNGTLAHHGYKRPGWGYIHGSCAGTGHEPWEVNVVTGQMALDYFSKEVPRLQGQLDALSKATELTPLWGRNPKPLVKSEAPPYEWKQLYENTERNIKRALEQATALRDEYEQKVREWEPAKVTTLEEVEVAAREKAEAVRRVRLDRYTVNRDKTIERLKKAFAKVQKGEQALKSARDIKPIVKALSEVFSGAEVIYSTFYGKPNELLTNYPGPADRNFVIADLGLDDIFKHMGLIQNGEYLRGRAVDELRSKAYSGKDPWPAPGLDAYVPFWPGWDGTIHYPEGSTGRNDNRHYWYR